MNPTPAQLKAMAGAIAWIFEKFDLVSRRGDAPTPKVFVAGEPNDLDYKIVRLSPAKN